jgi:twitching motility protein PilT
MAKIDYFLKAAVERNASDIHFVSGEPTRFRIDGDLGPFDDNPISNETLSEMLFELISDEEKTRLFSHRNLDKSVSLKGIGNFRLNIFFTRNGLSAVMRSIPSQIPTIADLNLPSVISDLCQFDKGLVLVTGPTGSGKSTTLSSMINEINNTFKGHILTVEDPVEFVHQSKKCTINQREIGSSCLSFSDALKYALREDPDVILIGEMRDLETISLALTAAETGHLVFGTLHTRGAGASVDRIIDSFPSNQQPMIRAMLSESLRAVISQALFKRASGKGRVAAYEIMVVNHAISNLIREGKTFQIPNAIQVGKKEGMITMDQSILDLVSQQLVNAEDVVPFMENPSLVESLLKNKPRSRPVAQGAQPRTSQPVSSNVKPLSAPPKLSVPPQKTVTPSTVPPVTKAPAGIPTAPKTETNKPQLNPTKPVNLQDSFKSLLDEVGDEQLLSELEGLNQEKKKTG